MITQNTYRRSMTKCDFELTKNVFYSELRIETPEWNQ